MIKVGDYKIEVKHFPDGTQMLFDCNVNNFPENLGKYVITWNYESDEELITLIYIVSHIRRTCPAAPIHLNMPYIPNARMDRTKNPGEVFTLKYFTNIINNLHFDKVFVLDPHYDVSVALLNNVTVINPNDYIAKTIQQIKDDNHIEDDKEIVIYFPDAGAYKRYKDIECLKPYEKIYGQKVRDWNTGKITGLTIVDKDNNIIHGSLENNYVLMIDDIISYGGTMYYSALKINEFNSKKIYTYATHVEPKSFWDIDKGTFIKAFGYHNNDGSKNKQIVTKLYTTNSIYNLNGNDFIIPIPIAIK